MTQKPKIKAHLGQPEIFPNIDEAHAAAIGYVATRWSDVENSVAALVRNTLRLNSLVGNAVVANLQFLAIQDIATTLVDLAADEKLAKSWSELMARAERLRPTRNLIIHGEWNKIGDFHKTSKIKARGKLATTESFYTEDELIDIANMCTALADDICVFSVRLYQANAIERIHEGDSYVRDRWRQEQSRAPAPNPKQPKTPQSRAPAPKIQQAQDRSQNLSSAQKRALHQKGNAS